MKTTLVSTAELVEHPEWRVLDCRHDLSDPARGQAAYRSGHIPGAVHAHLERDLSGAKTGSNGRHPLPEPQEFAEWLSLVGLKGSDQVVAYDDGKGAFAPRLWWMLRWVGHDAVAVLDGGFAKWAKEGREVSVAEPSFAASEFRAAPRDGMWIDGASVLRNALAAPGHRELLVVDARGADRYRGENETIDAVAGHIPGAVNRFYPLNLSEEGVFKSAEQLRAEFGAVLAGRPAGELVSQCGSGVTACNNLLAMEIAGLPGARLYPGSWSEWSSDPSRPVAVGELP